MKKSYIIKSIIFGFLSIISLFAFAKQEKVIQIFRNGQVIQEYSVSEVDYIEVNDLILAPGNVNASVSGNQITVKWNPIDGATYNIYRSGDNVSFSMLASALKTASYTDTNPLSGSNYYRVKAIVGDVESGYTATVSAVYSGSALESGIYLGVSGFNESLYTYPVRQLNSTSLTGFNSFIDGLAMKDGTILYYSVDEALNILQSTQLPGDVSTVAVVTFTDGLDQGSLGMQDKYIDKLEYLNAVNERLKVATVAGQKVVAYSIGLKGNDVTDNNMFTQNLKKLAYPSENAKEVSNMSEVNAKFEEIAKTLSESNYIQKVKLKCPVVSNGARIRFTLDNITTPSKVNSSKLYIEGIYNFREKSLENIVYYGMECESGKTVKGVQNGIFVSFTFDGIRTADNGLIKSSDIREWEYVTSNSGWQINSEFSTENGADVEVTRSSAAIMLVLDSSSSLGSQFGTLKTSAKNFIKILYNALNDSNDPNPGTDPNPGKDPEGTINGHEYVDLGLPSGLKWATCNVGASSPTDSGDYFAWGETTTKSTYTQSNSKTTEKEIGDISGNVAYDAARANWGGTWRMPSNTEMQELVDKCTWTWTSKSGINGYLVEGPNDNTIFLPAAGYRYSSSLRNSGSEGKYWSSTPYLLSQGAYVLLFGGSSRYVDYLYDRASGRPVRAVSE